MKILGCDVGQSGALAVIRLDNGAAPVLVDLLDVPMLGIGASARVDVIQVRDWVVAREPDCALVERGMALPRQGSTSGYKYGRTVGSLESAIVLSGVPWSLIEPAAWKKYHKLGPDKEQARQRAIQLLPGAHHLLARKRDHNRAEAMLIALSYGGRT
jgi:crossover junction endodeoxyribonuclease RuvC